MLDDLDDERMARFVRTARRVRQFPLSERTAPADLLTHLNLMKDGRPTNAAVLLFGKAPQRFLIASEVRCARFHGAEVEKPIPAYQVYKGTVFELVDQAVDFVLGKIDRAIGTRAESVRAPRMYEIPPEVITEAVVNAVAHRDYTSNGSVQVMLFSDRLEVRNPGRLSSPLTLEELRVAHNSVPGNPLLSESLYLAEYIERMGTGTLDMIRRCAAAGLPEPEFAVTDGFVTTIRRATSAARAVARTVQEAEATTQEGDQTTQEIDGTTQEIGSTTQEDDQATTQEAENATQEIDPTTQEDNQTTQEATRQRILDSLEAEPEITRRRLAERLGISPDGVKYHLDKLRGAGVIRHVGPTKAGRWEVLK